MAYFSAFRFSSFHAFEDSDAKPSSQRVVEQQRHFVLQVISSLIIQLKTTDYLSSSLFRLFAFVSMR